MAFNFIGKNILVTGASRGIGRALVKALSKTGGNVFGVATNQSLLDSLAAECENVKTLQLDVGDWKKTREVIQNLPTFDAVVNNAGVLIPLVPSTEATEESMDTAFRVNVKAAANIIQVTAKKMIVEKKKGSIVNVSSVGGISSFANSLAYNTSKAALDMVTKQYALELGPYNIRVNSLNPTIVWTDMAVEYLARTGLGEYYKSMIPMGRFVEADECVNPIMYLLSDYMYSSMVNGTMNVVDGGQLCCQKTKQNF